nr:6-hydroxymethylpterin diphosphokinase MptE-like protein [Pseudoalteromonas sp. XMcav2-N]
MLSSNQAFLADRLPDALNQQITSFSLADSQQLTHDFYGADAQASCRAQTGVFLQHPQHLSVHFQSAPNSDNAHQQAINRLNEHATKLGWRPNSKPQRGTLVILGSGAGYHISELLQRINYSDVIVIEPHAEQWAMTCIHSDLQALQRLCQQRSGTLSVLSCSEFTHFEQAFKQLIKQHGTQLVADISVFRHYSHPLFDQLLAEFKAWRNSALSMWGFVEDELMGLRHTQSNSQKHRITGHGAALSGVGEVPVVVVGNGPSLDQDITYLKSVRNRVLVASCGTALNALLHNNIVPDLQIEMERTAATFYLKKEQLTDPRLNDVVLIGLNTLYPAFVDQFKYRILFAKGHDLGAHALASRQPGLTPLFHCNPTVTNMATAALCRLGFQHLILLGCDYGYETAQHHHSRHSGYFNPDSALSEARFAAEFSVRGNFCDKVYTTRIYNESRLAQEALLRTQPRLRVDNTSHGAFIEGTRTIRLADITLGEHSIDATRTTIKTYASDHTPCGIDIASLLHPGIAIIQQLRNALLRAHSTLEVQNTLINTLTDLTHKPELMLSHVILSGSIKYLNSQIASHINHLPPATSQDYFTELKPCLDTFCESVLTKLSLGQ